MDGRWSARTSQEADEAGTRSRRAGVQVIGAWTARQGSYTGEPALGVWSSAHRIPHKPRVPPGAP